MKYKLWSLRFVKPVPGRRASGFTLVEVSVALAIFVFGALAIIRIFPPALNVIQNSESRQSATLLGRSTIANLTAGINSVPDAIFDAVPSTTPLPEPTPNEPYANVNGQTKALAVIGSSSKNVSLPTSIVIAGVPYSGITETAFSNSALGRFKRVFGQRYLVQQSSGLGAAPYNTTQLFIVTQFPYSDYRSVRIHTEDTVTGVRVDAGGYLDFRDARRSSDPDTIFSSSVVAARPPDSMRSTTTTPVTFYVSYRWSEQLPGSPAPRIQGVTDEPIRFPVDASWDINFSGRVLQGIRANGSVIPGTVKVRYRKPVGYTTTPPTNYPRRGYIGDLDNNPVTGVSAGSTVSVDYDVEDWRWIVDDNAPSESPTPTPGPTPSAASMTTLGTTRLALRNITDDPAYPVYGLLTQTQSSGITVANGQWTGDTPSGVIYLPTGTTDQDTTARAALRRGGRVIYSYPAATYPAPRARTVYRAIDGWAHQLSVGARSYLPVYGGALTNPGEHPLEGWRTYVAQISGGQTYLYFRPSEAGKAIMVAFEFLDPGPPAVFRTVPSGAFAIEDDVIDAPSGLPAAFVGASGKVSRVELTNPQGRSFSATAILSVQGIGMTARTAWIDKDHYRQEVVNGYRPVE